MQKNSARDPSHAGQAVVQMVVQKGTRLEYAIKFFVSDLAFIEERCLYSQYNSGHGEAFAKFLPKVLCCTIHSSAIKLAIWPNVFPNKSTVTKRTENIPYNS